MIRTSKISDAAFLAFLREHPVSGAKGDNTVESAEHSQAQFTQILQNAFATSFGASQNVLNFLNGKLNAMVNNPTGFSPTAKAALTTNAITQSATDTQNAIKASQEAAAMRGGNGLPSGVQEQVTGQINAAGANEESGALNSINLADEQQKQTNYWNAVSGLNSVAAQENPTGFAGASNSSSGALAGLSEADSAAKKTGFTNSFENSFGSALGEGLGSLGTGGGFNNPFKH